MLSRRRNSLLSSRCKPVLSKRAKPILTRHTRPVFSKWSGSILSKRRNAALPLSRPGTTWQPVFSSCDTVFPLTLFSSSWKQFSGRKFSLLPSWSAILPGRTLSVLPNRLPSLPAGISGSLSRRSVSLFLQRVPILSDRLASPLPRRRKPQRKASSSLPRPASVLLRGAEWTTGDLAG